MRLLLDPINISKSKLDSRDLMQHQREAVDSMNSYYQLKNENGKEQNGLVVMPTGERVIIVMGAICVIKSRVSGTFNKYNSCIA